MPVRAGELTRWARAGVRAGARHRLRGRRTRTCCSRLAGQLAVALQRALSARGGRHRAPGPRRWRPSTTWAWRPAALRDLRLAVREGHRGGGARLIRADHASVLRLRRGRRRAAHVRRLGRATRIRESLQPAGVPPGRGRRRPGGARPASPRSSTTRAPTRAFVRARQPGVAPAVRPAHRITTGSAGRGPVRRPERDPHSGRAALHATTTSTT